MIPTIQSQNDNFLIKVEVNLSNLSKSFYGAVCDWRVRAATLVVLACLVVSTVAISIVQGQPSYVGAMFTLITCIMASACVFVKMKTSGVFKSLLCLLCTTMIAMLSTEGGGFDYTEEILKSFSGDGVLQVVRMWLLHTSLCAMAIKTMQTAVCRF